MEGVRGRVCSHVTAMLGTEVLTFFHETAQRDTRTREVIREEGDVVFVILMVSMAGEN